jgi:hypothetical protein
VAPATVHRVLVRRGFSRLRGLDPPTGEQLREVVRYEHDRVGDLVHVDVKKLGGIPTGGGRRMHDRGTEAARAAKRTGPGTGKVGCTYLHTAIDDHSRLAYTEALDDEKVVTAAAFWHRSQLLQPRAPALRARRPATHQPDLRQRLPHRVRPAAEATRHDSAAAHLRGRRGTNVLRHHN